MKGLFVAVAGGVGHGSGGAACNYLLSLLERKIGLRCIEGYDASANCNATACFINTSCCLAMNFSLDLKRSLGYLVPHPVH
jgi:hypothetical protein